MAVSDIVPVPGAQFEETLASASPDLLRAMIREFAQRMMDADVEVACGAGYGEVTPERVNSRNGYRRRERDTRAGTIELAIPKLRQGSYFPGFLEHRRRAERALASVVATSYLLGVSTRRVEKLAASLGVTGLSKSQVSVMAAELDELVESFRNRPLDRGMPGGPVPGGLWPGGPWPGGLWPGGPVPGRSAPRGGWRPGRQAWAAAVPSGFRAVTHHRVRGWRAAAAATSRASSPSSMPNPPASPGASDRPCRVW